MFLFIFFLINFSIKILNFLFFITSPFVNELIFLYEDFISKDSVFIFISENLLKVIFVFVKDKSISS